MENMTEEQKEKLEKINKEGTLKLQMVNTLKETTKMVGEFEINVALLDDADLVKILDDVIPALKKFNKDIACYLSK